jgi:hypothetical protein
LDLDDFNEVRDLVLYLNGFPLLCLNLGDYFFSVLPNPFIMSGTVSCVFLLCFNFFYFIFFILLSGNGGPAELSELFISILDPLFGILA